jgi:hypothetical protein
MYKSLPFFMHEQVEFEIKKKHYSIYISTQKKKYLSINLTKYVQNIQKENYKTLMN